MTQKLFFDNFSSVGMSSSLLSRWLFFDSFVEFCFFYRISGVGVLTDFKITYWRTFENPKKLKDSPYWLKTFYLLHFSILRRNKEEKWQAKTFSFPQLLWLCLFFQNFQEENGVKRNLFVHFWGCCGNAFELFNAHFVFLSPIDAVNLMANY